jgi:hypothetical protein
MNYFVIILIVILVFIYLFKKFFFNETFKNTTDTSTNRLKLYVFVSDHCPHCHTYLNNHHNDIITLTNSKGIDIEKVESDGSAKSNDLFTKYDVQFIPTGIIVKENTVLKNLGSNITPQSVKLALEN